MNSEQIKHLNKIALQCSQFEDGQRWCDFCGKSLYINEPSLNHKEDCPISTMYGVLYAKVEKFSSTNTESFQLLVDFVGVVDLYGYRSKKAIAIWRKIDNFVASQLENVS